MARLARKTSKLFCENAQQSDVGQFGSLNAGTKVETLDIDTIQSLSAWGDGWQAVGLGQNCYPTRQERNGLDYVQSYMTNYLYQEGIPEWDGNTVYYIGSLVKLINGTNVNLYQSLIDNNTASLSNTSAWLAWGFADKTLSNITAIDNNAQTLLNAIYANKNIAVTHSSGIAAGTTIRPIYVSPSGVATPCTGIDTTNLCCTTKATTVSSASTTKPAVIVENYVNGTSWYRKWSDGWIEQGGLTGQGNYISIYFLKAFSNINYTLTTGTYNETNDNAFSTNVSAIANAPNSSRKLTNVGFTLIGWSSGYNTSWYACGY